MQRNFEKRKVSIGTCGRAFSTPCVHEHACVRCSLLRPDPAQRGRLEEIRDNLIARIAEAEREGWLGEVEGLRVSLAGAEGKLAQVDRRCHRPPWILACPELLGSPTRAPPHVKAHHEMRNSTRPPFQVDHFAHTGKRS